MPAGLNRTRLSSLFVLPIALLSLAFADEPPARVAPPVEPVSKLGALDYWDDGLSEMCFYDAKMTIYGQPRDYTRVQLTNRQWMDRETGVKTDDIDSPTAIPVLKLNIAEEVPTENYNYRFLTTVFVDRRSLRPFKLTSGSQEWCGNTFKHLYWSPAGLHYQCFSYFPQEGDAMWDLERNVYPFEAALLWARELAAGGTIPEDVQWLPPVRSSHEVAPKLTTVKTDLGKETIRTPAGSFACLRLKMTFGERTATFWVEQVAPYKLIRYEAPGESMTLKGVEKRPYWDRSSKSKFHKPSAAP